jgi:tRNA threonylcarbamoyladenosine biosynthesis protein TsaB
MAFIISIESATSVCSVALSEDSELIGLNESTEEKSHATQLTVFIDELMKGNNVGYNELNAVAVSEGPGSYTGLRIGVSAAKGLCYSLNIPLIAVNTLQAMALGAMNLHEIKAFIETNHDLEFLFCPMIDARRQEVYAAFYDENNKEVEKTAAVILEPHSFEDMLDDNYIFFFGDGAVKAKEIMRHRNAIFVDNVQPSASNMIPLALDAFNKKKFVDTAYFEPFYLKDFVATTPKQKF